MNAVRPGTGRRAWSWAVPGSVPGVPVLFGAFGSAVGSGWYAAMTVAENNTGDDCAEAAFARETPRPST
ncbi:hypothetical protein I3F58_09750 [Streptomyces sp. MUM 203J]|uniref:hypothetical protein n=1 Tax=Streptomyces sp. MUM 203J TaxID=2791990 RepID=UPI001F036672|nr:hypothetical protein [Streptomyces sp. MUM 203J]MCH0539842.1 hypothetical protein [Streptomyces sp. MUM 203J]